MAKKTGRKGKVKAKAKAKDKREAKREDKSKGKGKVKAKAQDKARPKDKGEDKDKERGKGKSKGKGKGKAKVDVKAKRRDQSKPKPKDKGKGKSKRKGIGKAKAEAKAKRKGKPRDKRKAKARDKGEPKAQSRAGTLPMEAALQKVLADAEVPTVGTLAAPRRWKQVAAKLGLEGHIRSASQWDGQSAPPILTGFSFVRHVESDARDLKCAGTSVTMTRGVVVQREDGRLFLISRGVAKKYLGLQIPWKDRANAGQRFLTAQERHELGQPDKG